MISNGYRAIPFLITLCSSLLFGCGLGEPGKRRLGNPHEEVPSEYRSLNHELKKKIHQIDRYLDARWDGRKYHTAFGVELLVAHPALLLGGPTYGDASGVGGT